MVDDIAALFYDNVVATFEDYLANKRSGKAGRNRDLQSALATGTALYHFREHLPAAYPKSRADIVRECPDYALLGDVVNTGKHKGLTRGKPQLSSAGQIEERFVVTLYEDAQGTYRDVEKQVILELDDGTERNLLEVLINVINFWQTELAALGLIPSRPRYTLPNEPQPKARADCNHGQIDLECIQGVRIRQTYCLRRFNYATGLIEPVDLTGAKFECQIYKPCHNVDISVTNDSTGHKVTRTVSLSEEESQEILGCRTDQEKQRFLAKLPHIQEAVRQLGKEVGCLRVAPPAPT
jgi:hypothetical protein